MAAVLECPDHKLVIVAGSIVRLGRFESTEWLVAYGWYTWGGNRPVCGWYLSQCDNPGTMKPLQATDLDDIYMVQAFDPYPCPPTPPGVPITEEEKALYDRAFVTIDSYEDLPNLVTENLFDGKLVRVQHDINNEPAYYIWDSSQMSWLPIEFGGGSDVVPNPEGEPTEALTKISIDNTIYSIPSPLPEVEPEDAGKALIVNNQGNWEAESIPAELPSVTSQDGGKVLTVDSNGNWVANNVPNEVPTATVQDAGKIIKVNNQGSYILTTETQELPTPTVGDIGKVLTIIDDGQGGAEWGEEVPSVNDDFIVTVDISDPDNPVSDKTVAEITAAVNSGKEIYLNTINSERDFYNATRVPLEQNNEANGYYFAYHVFGDGCMWVIHVSLRNYDEPDYDSIFFEVQYYEEAIWPATTILRYPLTRVGETITLPYELTFTEIYRNLDNGVNVQFTLNNEPDVYNTYSFSNSAIDAYSFEVNNSNLIAKHIHLIPNSDGDYEETMYSPRQTLSATESQGTVTLTLQ